MEVCVGSGLAKTVNANEILKNLVTFIDAKGGGKPDFAQAGGTNPQGFVELFKAAKNL
jgi:alanyl-tRNA synthetase